MRSMRDRTSTRTCSRCAISTSSTTVRRLSGRSAFDRSPARLLNASAFQEMRENAVKLYDSIGPNPRIVRIFMAEKGIEIPKHTVDLRGGENRQAEHLKRNP